MRSWAAVCKPRATPVQLTGAVGIALRCTCSALLGPPACCLLQGVAWDPAQQYVATQSADRTCRRVAAGSRSPEFISGEGWYCLSVTAGSSTVLPSQRACGTPPGQLLLKLSMPDDPGAASPPASPQGVRPEAARRRAQEQGQPVPAASRGDGARPVLRPHASQAGNARHGCGGRQARQPPAVCGRTRQHLLPPPSLVA